MKIDEFISLDWHDRLLYLSKRHNTWYRVVEVREFDVYGIARITIRVAENVDGAIMGLRFAFLGVASFVHYEWYDPDSRYGDCIVVEFKFDGNP